MKHFILLYTLVLVITGLLSACSSNKGLQPNPETVHTEQIVLVKQNNNLLWYMKTAQEYIAAGRYELAKEQLLLALALSHNDMQLRSRIAEDLAAVDMMIKTLR